MGRSLCRQQGARSAGHFALLPGTSAWETQRGQKDSPRAAGPSSKASPQEIWPPIGIAAKHLKQVTREFGPRSYGHFEDGQKLDLRTQFAAAPKQGPLCFCGYKNALFYYFEPCKEMLCIIVNFVTFMYVCMHTCRRAVPCPVHRGERTAYGRWCSLSIM